MKIIIIRHCINICNFVHTTVTTGADMDIETQDNTSYNIDRTQTIIDDLHTEPEKTIQS